jgi:hypothetical protein
MEESTPMILNAIEHWEQYRKMNTLDSLDDMMFHMKQSTVVDMEHPPTTCDFRNDFNKLLEAIEKEKEALVRLKNRFQVLHSRADSLRAGVSKPTLS